MLATVVTGGKEAVSTYPPCADGPRTSSWPWRRRLRQGPHGRARPCCRTRRPGRSDPVLHLWCCQ